MDSGFAVVIVAFLAYFGWGAYLAKRQERKVHVMELRIEPPAELLHNLNELIRMLRERGEGK